MLKVTETVGVMISVFSYFVDRGSKLEFSVAAGSTDKVCHGSSSQPKSNGIRT
jgi:hypothetical protein